MNIITASVRPDALTKGDRVYNPISKQWEPVQDAYWSDQSQRYVVWLGPLGHVLHTYGASEKVTKQRCYP